MEFLEQLDALERRCQGGIRLAGRRLDDSCRFDPGVQSREASRVARQMRLEMLSAWGIAAGPLDNRPNGAPRFPEGFVGSVAHDSDVVVVAVAASVWATAVGVDVEPLGGLPPECLEAVTTLDERAQLANLVDARLLFCAKEAVFKAISSSGGPWLEYADVEVDIQSETAVTSDQVNLTLRLSRGPRLLAIAILPCAAARMDFRFSQTSIGGLNG